MSELTHFSLCTGIGGLDLAAEWAGFRTVGQCEINDYASKDLAKNFPWVVNLHDIRAVTNERLRESGIDPDGITVLSAGFPCQPYSLAGKGLGDSDERDLWGEVARCLSEIRPPWFVGENTPGLFVRENQRYFRQILNDLSALGYTVGWGVWGACDVGAPHKRDRVFIIAHVMRFRWETRLEKYKKPKESGNGNPKKIRTFDDEWKVSPSRLFRLVHGVPSRVDRLRCLGNAVVPQQAYPIFKAIADFERSRV